MNLIEMLKNEVSGGVISSLSQKAGVTEDQVKTGFSAGIPAVLAGILKNGAGGGLLDSILPGLTGSAATNSPDDLLNGSSDSLLEKGKSMLGSLFGNDSGSVTSAVSTATGLPEGKSAGLLAMIVPLVTGLISKLMASKGWSVSDLLGKIFESKSEIAAALPPGLSSTLGIANIKLPNVGIPDAPQVEMHRASAIPSGRVPDKNTGGGFIKWLLPLIVVIVALWWMLGKKGCNETSVTSTVDSVTTSIDTMGGKVGGVVDATVTTVEGKLNEAGDYVKNLGEKMTRKLPDGKEISIAENSVENRLIVFIEAKDKPVDKTTWFTFDRLYFEPGKSTLKPESQEQLNNIAAILVAYPVVTLKLGGYTDSTGDAAVNKRISNERANTAKNELVKLGIDQKRLEAEGYGAEHPIASNDTPEGRAQNRRIDIRVTGK
ncbi:OmpA family protein [Pedobacter sp. PLR]|uniref:OmpA family protein n=1 Tax=Pedobacter sp. PLR TaxID=2994465 RepID=UPI00224514E9|nr:OmpA family protein [Pedobacter sp. PLR]MCX2450175.1 OmpA family protein [Pedobacter sp. PLR]